MQRTGSVIGSEIESANDESAAEHAGTPSAG